MKIEAVTAGAPLPDPAEITVEPTDGTSATFQFADIEYKLSMIPEGQESATFKYKVTESAYSMQGVGEKDSTEYEVTVTISDNGDGTLKVEKSENAESLNFKNKYDAKGSIPLKGTKKFKYGSFDDEEFTFSVYTEDGFSRAIDPGLFWTERDRNDPDFINDSINDPKVERVLTASTSDATVITDGKVSFDFKDAEGNKYLEYTLADIIDGEYVDGHLTKDFKYVVVEDIPEGAEKKTVDGVTFYYDSENDIKYDATEYHITITVTDNGDGTLKVTSKPEGELSFGFVNEKIYTELKLTKDIDSLVTGDTVDELTNVTCVFKVTYDDPILGRKVSRTVSVQFDAEKVAAETATVDKIPIEAEDSLKVEEVYAVDYTGQPKEGEALRRIDPETGIPFWTVAFENERNGNKTGSGVINSVEKNEDGFVITNRRDSTGKNPPPEQGDE